jgi:hypothetical protein
MQAAQAQADFEKKRDEWWERLPTKAKKAIVRKSLRTAAKAKVTQVRATLAAVDRTRSYICPKCWTAHPTPEARAGCKAGHRG